MVCRKENTEELMNWLVCLRPEEGAHHAERSSNYKDLPTGSDVLAFFMFVLLSCGDFRGQRFLGFVKADCLPRENETCNLLNTP